MNELESLSDSLQPNPVSNATTYQQGQTKYVYTIVDRPGHEKPFWLRVGTAWVNRDLSLNVKLDAHPANNKLHIRDADSSYQSRRDGAPARDFTASHDFTAGGVS